MQAERKPTRRRTYRHIFSLGDSLGFVDDEVLVQGIRSFRDSVEILQREGTSRQKRRYLIEMRQALAEMTSEARRRGLKLPEETTRRAS